MRTFSLLPLLRVNKIAAFSPYSLGHAVNRSPCAAVASKLLIGQQRRRQQQHFSTTTRSLQSTSNRARTSHSDIMGSTSQEDHPEELPPATTAQEAKGQEGQEGQGGQGQSKPPCPELPPLTPEQYRAYDRLAVSMEYFHEHFRRSWNLLYSACEAGRRPAGMSLKQFIDEGLSLARYLTMHHNIEEAHIFPVLARKMPEFRQTGGNSKKGELVKQHEAIHAGMDVFEAYLRACRNRECELELPVLRQKMDAWGAVLLRHLDQEVQTLRAENMRRFWTLDEIRAIPM